MSTFTPTPTTPLPALPETAVARSGLGTTVVAIGNEIAKGLRFGWDERKQITLELTMFVPLFLLFAALAAQGEAIVEGRFEWTFDERRTGWLLVGFVLGMFFFLQVQKYFWRQLGEIQAGTLEQVYLSPLPWWLLAAAGRELASILESLFVVVILYVVVVLTVGVDVDWHPVALVPIGLLLVGGFGHSLIIGGLTLLWKRVELLNDMLLMVVFFLGAVVVPLEDMPGWMAAIGRFLPVTHPITASREILLEGEGLTLVGDGGLLPMVALAVAWFGAGVLAFQAATRRVRRDGSLTRS